MNALASGESRESCARYQTSPCVSTTAANIKYPHGGNCPTFRVEPVQCRPQKCQYSGLPTDHRATPAARPVFLRDHVLKYMPAFPVGVLCRTARVSLPVPALHPVEILCRS